MKREIENRARLSGELIVSTSLTIREVAKVMKSSKSTIHKDVTERLLKINPILASQVRDVLNNHLEERAIRGALKMWENKLRGHKN